MTNGVDDDLVFGGLVEDEVGIGDAVMRRMAGSSVRVPMWGCSNRRSMTA
jgi:hypothetical protein